MSIRLTHSGDFPAAGFRQLQPDGRCYGRTIPGGAWDRHVGEYIAKRDGDQETAEKLAAEAQRIAAEQDRALAAIFNKCPA